LVITSLIITSDYYFHIANVNEVGIGFRVVPTADTVLKNMPEVITMCDAVNSALCVVNIIHNLLVFCYI